MTIATGLSATKAGFDLIKSLREVLGRPDVNPGDIQARLVELQSLMLDAQRALADAEEENRRLSVKLDEVTRRADLGKDMEFVHDGGYFVRASEGKKIPYCPLCWHLDGKTVPLEPQSTQGVYWCFVHKNDYKTKEGARIEQIARENW
jgi:hypothetical protein